MNWFNLPVVKNGPKRRVWAVFIPLSMLCFISCAERKPYVQMADVLPKIDSSTRYSLDLKTFTVQNDTNDKLLVLFTCSDDLDSPKVDHLTEKYYLNKTDILSGRISKFKIPAGLEAMIHRARPVVQLCRYNDSNYFLLLRDTLVKWNIYNQQTIVSKLKFPFDYPHDKYYLLANLINEFGFPMYCSDNYLHFGAYLVDKQKDVWTYEVEASPYQVNYAINGHSASYTSKFTYPDFIYKNHYGLGFRIYRCPTPDKDLISFPFSSNVYACTKDSGHIRVIGGKSIYQSKPYIQALSLAEDMRRISSDSEWYYYIHSEYYSQMIYNSNTRQYYRLYHHQIPLKKDDGYYYTHKDRVISLQVFDEHFSLVHEEILKGLWFALEFMPYERGFIINNNGVDFKKDHFEYLYYEVKPH